MTKAYPKIKKDILRESRTPSHDSRWAGRSSCRLRGKINLSPIFPDRKPRDRLKRMY